MRARGLIVLVVTGCLALAAGPAAGSYQPRVVGGTPASIEHWPFMAALVEHGQSAFDGQFCGGSVIAPTVVLTAAHCVSGGSLASIDVITGRAQLSAASTGQRVAVRAILVDPAFNANTEHHDAALLLLSAPTESPPIALAGSTDGPLLAPGAPLAVAGWGLLDNQGDAPDLLHTATVEALRIGQCQSAYGSDVTPTLMICAGTSHTGSPDACQGDSGGPLVSSLGGAPRLVGLVAFGGSRCGDPEAPGVYTRVNGEIPWIARVMRSATTMHGRAPTIRTRIGHITCGSVLCTVPVTVSGDVGAVGRIVVRVSRIGAATTEQATTAARVGPHAWSARIDLPTGSLHLVALGYAKSGAPFGRAGTANIQVTAG